MLHMWDDRLVTRLHPIAPRWSDGTTNTRRAGGERGPLLLSGVSDSRRRKRQCVSSKNSLFGSANQTTVNAVLRECWSIPRYQPTRRVPGERWADLLRPRTRLEVSKKRTFDDTHLLGVLPELSSLLPQRLRPGRELLHAAIRRGQALRYGGTPVFQSCHITFQPLEAISQAFQAFLEAGAQIVILSHSFCC